MYMLIRFAYSATAFSKANHMINIEVYTVHKYIGIQYIHFISITSTRALSVH